MLTEIRDRSSGAFAWVIAALIIIPMAFWGVQEYASTEANPSLLEIGDQKISQSEFEANLSSEQQRVRRLMGDNVNEDFLSSDSFRQSVLQRLVNRALLKQVAEDENYRVSNEQLADEIRKSDLFQLDGKFNQEAYERFLISSQFSKRRYEDSLRDDLALQQVMNGYEESAIVLPDEMRALLEAQVERRSFDVATLKQQDFVGEISVSQAEIEEHFNANQPDFMSPQKVSIEYLELNRDELGEEIEIVEEELRESYEQNAEAYISSAKRETRHILLATGGDEDDAAQLAKAQNLVSELRSGADFSELAKSHSQDPSSAEKGGSLGLVEAGQMVPEFEKATFALEQDAISDPVKSTFGYHIIQVTDIQASEQQSFDDVRLDLLRDEREQRAEERLIDLTDQLRDLAFEQPDNLDAAADKLGLELRKSELFDRNQGEGIAASPKIREVAFSEEVLIEELNSEPLELADGQVVVLRRLEEQEAAPKELSEVSARITEVVKNQKAIEKARVKGVELLAAAKLDWASISSNETLDLVSHNLSLIDQSRAIDPQVMEYVSSLQVKDGVASIGSVTGRNGDVHIVRLREIVAGDVETVSEQIKDATRRVLAQRNGGSLLTTYLDQLTEEQLAGIDLSTL